MGKYNDIGEHALALLRDRIPGFAWERVGHGRRYFWFEGAVGVTEDCMFCLVMHYDAKDGLWSIDFMGFEGEASEPDTAYRIMLNQLHATMFGALSSNSKQGNPLTAWWGQQ